MLKKILLLLFFASLAASAIFGFYFLKSKLSFKEFVSPIFHRNFTEKISSKIDANFALDFSSSQELITLQKVPRYLVYNAKTGKVYYSKNSNQKISPASFTKLLSAQVALDFIPLTEEITVSADSVEKVPTVLGLKPGEKFIVKDILRGSIATSGNDAAQVLADESIKYLKGTNQEFLYYMNKKAELLKMQHSHFANPD
ncbi:MAG: D-alanyl-D-alanine carboxypeptidase family protein, partial [Alphaproteobacteria bacterium]